MGSVAAGRASGVKLFCQDIQMYYEYESILDQLRPKLPTTASNVTWQGTCENYATATAGFSQTSGERKEKGSKNCGKRDADS